MTGEAKIDKPFPVEAAGRFLQQADLFLVDFDQLIVGRKNINDMALDVDRR